MVSDPLPKGCTLYMFPFISIVFIFMFSLDISYNPVILISEGICKYCTKILKWLTL